MKNILRTIFVFVVGAVFLVSCEKKETNFDAMFNDWDPGNATYYLQFVDASQTLETGVNNDGSLKHISTTIAVALIGNPQNSDIVIPISPAPSTTISPDMYTLSASSITIPAGQSSGSITLTTITDNMPIDTWLDLVINLGTANDAPTGTTLTYKMKRIKYCYTDITALVGNWSGTDSWGYASHVVTTLVNGELIINGIGFGWFQDWWGEVIVTNTPLVMTVNAVTGSFTIAEQPYLTSTWNGAPQPAYGLSGSGKIDACTKTMTLDYIFHQDGGTFNGSAWGPAFKEVITLN